MNDGSDARIRQQKFLRLDVIPVGANLPASSKANSRQGISTGGKLGVAVFGITGGESGRWEIENIMEAIRFAASCVGNLRLIVSAAMRKARKKNSGSASAILE